MYIDFKIVTRAEDILTQKTSRPGLGNGLLQDIGDPGIFAADIDIRHLAAQRVRRDDQSLDQQMREEFHEIPVLERTGLRFIRITNQVTRYSLRLGEETPF